MKNLLISILLLGSFLCSNAYSIDVQQIQKILASDADANDRFANFSNQGTKEKKK